MKTIPKPPESDNCKHCFAWQNPNIEDLSFRARAKLLLTLAGCLRLLPARLVHELIRLGGLTHV